MTAVRVEAWTRGLTPKDLQYLAWCATGAKLFSTCSRAQYMAVIVSRTGRVVGSGYNGGPPKTKHCVHGGCERVNREPGERDEGYADCIAIHAETNAIAWSEPGAREGATLYVNGEPCWNCAKLLLGSGVETVVYLDEGGTRRQGIEYLGRNGMTLVGAARYLLEKA